MRPHLLALFGLLIWCAASVAPIRAQKAEALHLFDEGNSKFDEGAYAAALTSYHGALDLGLTSGALYHNMGSAYYRLDEIGQSVRYYQKARRLLGDQPQVLHNLAIVESRVSSPFSHLPAPFWRDWWNDLFVWQGWPVFFWPGAVLYLMAALLYGQRIWANVRSGWHRRLRATTLLAGSILLLVSIAVSAERTHSSQAVIIVPGAQFSETPGATGTVAIPEGVVVEVLESTNEEARVRLPNGTPGYVTIEALGDI